MESYQKLLFLSVAFIATACANNNNHLPFPAKPQTTTSGNGNGGAAAAINAAPTKASAPAQNQGVDKFIQVDDTYLLKNTKEGDKFEITDNMSIIASLIDGNSVLYSSEQGQIEPNKSFFEDKDDKTSVYCKINFKNGALPTTQDSKTITLPKSEATITSIDKETDSQGFLIIQVDHPLIQSIGIKTGINNHSEVSASNLTQGCFKAKIGLALMYTDQDSADKMAN